MQNIIANTSKVSAQTVASDDIMSYMTQVTTGLRRGSKVKGLKQIAELV